MRSGPRVASIVVAAVALASCASTESPATVRQKPDLPVITRVADKDIPYPTAGVSGSLQRKGDCLLLGGAVVFWPAGATWDEPTETVRFGGDFAGFDSASVGTDFSGGGGVWGLRDDLSGVLDESAERAVGRCLEATGATEVMMVYPE